MDNWLFGALLLAFVGTTFMGVVVSFTTSDMYTGRLEANQRRRAIARRYLTETNSLQHAAQLIELYATDDKAEGRLKSWESWAESLPAPDRHAPTAAEFAEFYCTLRVPALGDVPERTQALIARVESATEEHVTALMSYQPNTFEEVFDRLNALKQATKKIGMRSWGTYQGAAGLRESVGFWTLFTPEFWRFLDVVGRGSTFGLLASTIVNLAGLAFGWPLDFAAVSVGAIGVCASIAGMLHGQAVFEHADTPYAAANVTDAWFAKRPRVAYWAMLGMILVLLLVAIGTFYYFVQYRLG